LGLGKRFVSLHGPFIALKNREIEGLAVDFGGTSPQEE